MSPTIIREAVVKIIGDQLALDDSFITDEKRIMEDLGADSLDCTEIVMHVEKTFEITIYDEDSEKFQTVGDVVNYISGRLNA